MFAGREKARRGGSKRDPITQQHSSFFFPSFFVRRLPGAISSMRGGKPSSSPPTTEKPKRRSLVPNVTWTTSGSSWPFCNENSVILLFPPLTSVCLYTKEDWRLATSRGWRLKSVAWPKERECPWDGPAAAEAAWWPLAVLLLAHLSPSINDFEWAWWCEATTPLVNNPGGEDGPEEEGEEDEDDEEEDEDEVLLEDDDPGGDGCRGKVWKLDKLLGFQPSSLCEETNI